MKRSGTANLPLHHGSPPRWLWHRMVSLSGSITEFIVDEFGTTEFLGRVANPHWFQAFSCIIGFDWHSSGTTTTTCGALKQGVDTDRTGLAITGGKGRSSRRTLEEIPAYSDIFSLPDSRSGELVHASRITAKVDNSCIQDGYNLYHHSFIFDEKGNWCVVQQGMGERDARRYHWLHGVEDFIDEPHEGIACDSAKPSVLDMTARQSSETRCISVDLVKDRKRGWESAFRKIKKQRKDMLKDGATAASRHTSGSVHAAGSRAQRQSFLFEFEREKSGEIGEQIMIDETAPHLEMPSHHPVLEMDLTSRDIDVLRRAYEIQPADYEELISIRGLGPKKIRALALMADLIYGAEPSWNDPVKYSFSHGGKDGYPFPVDRDAYDNSINFLKDALYGAELERKERRGALDRLERLLR